MNFAELITGVTRSVKTQGSHHTVQIEHVYEASPEEIWDAITQPQRLEKWFEPTEGELIEGGRYQLTESGTEGTIQRCERLAERPRGGRGRGTVGPTTSGKDRRLLQGRGIRQRLTSPALRHRHERVTTR